MRKITIISIAIITVAVISVYLVRENVLENSNSLLVSGNIEITDVDVSFQIPGRVTQRLFSEGDKISEGDIVAYLDDRLLKEEVSLHEAELLAAKAELKEMEEGYLPEEISQAQAKLQQAQADLKRLSADFKRQQNLFQNEVISSREFDVSGSAYAVAKAQVFEAKERLAFFKRGTRVEKIAQARANVLQREQGLAAAKTKLGYTTVYSPLTGYVLSDNIEAGEYVSAGTPIITVGNLRDVWLRGYIDESDLGKIKLGQEVDVTTDSYPNKKYIGKLSFISSEAEFTPKNIQTEKERVKLVYRVKITIDNPDSELKPGMPADGTLFLQGLKQK